MTKFENIVEKSSAESDFAELSCWQHLCKSLTAGNVNDCDVACEMLDDFHFQVKTIMPIEVTLSLLLYSSNCFVCR